MRTIEEEREEREVHAEEGELGQGVEQGVHRLLARLLLGVDALHLLFKLIIAHLELGLEVCVVARPFHGRPARCGRRLLSAEEGDR